MIRRSGGILVILVGVLLFQSKVRSFLLAKESRSWPVVEGTLDSLIFTPVDSIRFSATISYRYSFGGTDYRGSTLHPTKSLYRASEAASVDSALSGSTVRVHVAPVDPGRSTILTGTGVPEVEGFLAGIVALAGGIFFGGGVLLLGARHPTRAILDQMKRVTIQPGSGA
ncbi:MAG: DUF3592 domain-containing protein [Fibrobacteria bacterium]|nr:DUF3592 domain-containing protein [Fibrobacteria bacterium]